MTFKRVEARPEFVSYKYYVLGSHGVSYETSVQQDALEYAKKQTHAICSVSMMAVMQFDTRTQRDTFVNVNKVGYSINECGLEIEMSACLFLYGEQVNRGRGFKLKM